MARGLRFRLSVAAAFGVIAATGLTGPVGGDLQVSAQQPAPAFTAEQADAGRQVYDTSCASCHMPDLGGRNEAPPLAGPNFAWRSRPARDLFDYISAQMPPGGGNLSPSQYRAVTSFILSRNGLLDGAAPPAGVSTPAAGVRGGATELPPGKGLTV